MDAVNTWLGGLFARDNVDRTVAALVASQSGEGATSGREVARQRLASAEARLERFRAAIGAGVDPAALVDAINEAQAQRAAARAELEDAPAPDLVTDAEVYAMIDSLGDVGRKLAKARTDSLAGLYEALNLAVRYEHDSQAAQVTIQPVMRVNSVRVRGGN
ncbi:hypothetical protein [Amycolatopsis deserti]|nr:hypothetical protein [Amycolatopsis deserti]